MGGAYDRLDEEVTLAAGKEATQRRLQHLDETCDAAANSATTDDLLSDVQRPAGGALATRATGLLQLARNRRLQAGGENTFGAMIKQFGLAGDQPLGRTGVVPQPPPPAADSWIVAAKTF